MADKDQRSSLHNSKESRYRPAQKKQVSKKNSGSIDGILMKQIRLFSVFQDGIEIQNTR